MAENNRSKISVIVPTNNRAKFLKIALESIVSQSYTNWNVIIIANGCTDNTAEIVEPFLSDSRFKFIEIKDSIGGSKARNIGIDLADGDYVAFLDDDDEWYYNKLSSQLKILEETGASLSGCWFDIFNNGKFCKKIKLKSHIILDDLFYENILGSFSFVMVKYEKIRDLRINEDLRACQDWDLWVKILSKNESEAVIVKQSLVKYNEHSNDRLTNNTKDAFEARLKFLNYHWDILPKRAKTFHNLYNKIFSNEKSKDWFLLRFIYALNFLISSKKMHVSFLYMALVSYFLGMRNKKLILFVKSFYKKFTN